MASLPDPQPHGPIEPLFEDVYWVQGSMRLGVGVRISRNMAILQQGSSLALINPVRLTAAGEDKLVALGKIEHIVRLGNFHGLDDAYYVATFGARFWCQSGSQQYPEPIPDVPIEEGTGFAFNDTEFFVFRGTKHPECALLYRRHGGVLLTCDALQHHDNARGCSLLAKVVMRAMGFMHPVNIGPPWRKIMTPPGGSLRPEFERLAELPFDHLLGAHGNVCKGGARDALGATIKRVFGA